MTTERVRPERFGLGILVCLVVFSSVALAGKPEDTLLRPWGSSCYSMDPYYQAEDALCWHLSRNWRIPPKGHSVKDRLLPGRGPNTGTQPANPSPVPSPGDRGQSEDNKKSREGSQPGRRMESTGGSRSNDSGASRANSGGSPGRCTSSSGSSSAGSRSSSSGGGGAYRPSSSGSGGGSTGGSSRTSSASSSRSPR